MKRCLLLKKRLVVFETTAFAEKLTAGFLRKLGNRALFKHLCRISYNYNYL